MENGFNIWSFSGKLLYRISKDHVFQVKIILNHVAFSLWLLLHFFLVKKSFMYPHLLYNRTISKDSFLSAVSALSSDSHI